MRPGRLLIFSLAAPAAMALAAGCHSMALSSIDSTESELTHDGPALSNVWVSYAPGGVSGATSAEGVVTVGGLRPPIFSLRMVSSARDGTVEADWLTPGGFDPRHVRAGDIRQDGFSGDPYPDAGLSAERLEQVLMHHRPAVRLRVGPLGEPQAQASSEIRRHSACTGRLLRAAIEEQLAAAENPEQRRHQQERLRKRDNRLARTTSFGIDNASLLLRFAMLALPTAGDPGPAGAVPERGALTGQKTWRSGQIGLHGRPVRLQLNVQSMATSPAANLCRSIAFEALSGPRSDTCTIEGVIDRRDGWPITLTISRRGESASGATETQARSFDRVTPLQGYVAPANPCRATR